MTLGNWYYTMKWYNNIVSFWNIHKTRVYVINCSYCKSCNRLVANPIQAINNINRSFMNISESRSILIAFHCVISIFVKYEIFLLFTDLPQRMRTKSSFLPLLLYFYFLLFVQKLLQLSLQLKTIFFCTNLYHVWLQTDWHVFLDYISDSQQ